MTPHRISLDDQTVVCHSCGSVTHGEHQATCSGCAQNREWCCGCWENEDYEDPSLCRVEQEH